MTREQKEQIDRINELTLNLCNDAYNKGFEAGTESIQECSWEKGVRDAWEYIRDRMTLEEHIDMTYQSRWYGLMNSLDDLDPVIYTKDYVDSRNKEDLAKTEPIEVGDIVTRYDGEECIVTYIDKDFVYTLNLEDGRDLLVCTFGELTKTGKKAVVKVFKPLAVGELK